MGESYRLLSDQKSTMGDRMYGRKGDTVTLISIHDHVALVRGDKESFSVQMSELTTELVKGEPEIATPTKAPVNVKNNRVQKRKAPPTNNNIQTLF